VQVYAEDKLAKFERCVLPHLDAAYNLARWLMRSIPDAEDMVQEAYLRAFNSFDSFHGEDGRPWLLTIVRNTCFTWLRKNRVQDLMAVFDETFHGTGMAPPDPEALQVRESNRRTLHEAIDRLPAEFREVIVLRELEEMSYKQIAAITGAPIGTVMSRLARARQRLQTLLTSAVSEEERR
jgi:RNA polymerase sigma factor (sigma-70 family)